MKAIRKATRPAVLLLIAILGACGAAGDPEAAVTDGREHLTARPLDNVTSLAPGTYGLFVAVPKDAMLVVPSAAASGGAVPLLVMLHGAGGTPTAIDQVVALGEQYGFAVLLPKSRENTWDVALGGFGDDVVVLNKALQQTFQRLRVDPVRIGIAGFSDGASYALSLGLANGDLFSHVIAFSPGFLTVAPRRGKPPFYVAHGTSDGVLPVENTRDNIVPYLVRLGYTVQYYEFQGGHSIDDTAATQAFMWFNGSGQLRSAPD